MTKEESAQTTVSRIRAALAFRFNLNADQHGFDDIDQSIRDGIETIDTNNLFDGRRIVLFAVPGALSPAQAQNPIQADGQNPMGARPTADSVNEEFLFKQESKIRGRVSIPDGGMAITPEIIKANTWWDIAPISAGLFGVPLGFAVIIVVSLLTKAPGKEIQDLVEHVRYPSLDGKVAAAGAGH